MIYSNEINNPNYTSRCSPLKITDISGAFRGDSRQSVGAPRPTWTSCWQSAAFSWLGSWQVSQLGQSDLSSSHSTITDLLNTGQAKEELGLQDLANIHMRNVRETAKKTNKKKKVKRNLKKTENKKNKKRRRNRKTKKDQKKRGKNGKKKNKNRNKQNRKNPRPNENPKQASCQTSSEVDGVCIQVGRERESDCLEFI